MSQLNIEAKKKFGQHFLVNSSAKNKVFFEVKKLVVAYPDRDLIEIGPGQGDLTEDLVKLEKPLVALEIDREAYEYIDQKFGNLSYFSIDLCDALDEISHFDSKYFTKPQIFVSNLPYNVGSRILVDLGVNFPETPFLVVLQSEVAKKPHPDSDFTIFGAWINLFWDFKYIMELAPGNFKPAPNVMSALASGIPKNSGYSYEKRKKMLEILKKLNANPKKTLSNNLKNLGFEKTSIDTFFLQTKLDIKTRMGWGNYADILNLVYEFTK
jgi:16S rRNA (adenine1518-N6/adenine1519-N6)-dimethyltransferase